METVSGIVEEVEETSSSAAADAVSSEDISTNATETDILNPTADTENWESTENKASERNENDVNNSSQAQGAGSSHRPAQPKELVAQGVSFLSGLAETLKSPEATAQLVDSIVEKDEQTGKTSIKIPVESKETVANLFSLIGKLFAK